MTDIAMQDLMRDLASIFLEDLASLARKILAGLLTAFLARLFLPDFGAQVVI